MNAVKGRVHNGRIEIETALPEGVEVVVLTADPDETFDVGAAEEALLVERVREAHAGELEPAATVLARLRSR